MRRRPTVDDAALAPLPPDAELDLSHKQIDDYQTCPLKYFNVHVRRIPIRRHHAVAYGAVMHKVVEYYLRRRVGGQLHAARRSAGRVRPRVGGRGHHSRSPGQPRARRGLPHPRARRGAQGGRPRGAQALLAPGGGGRHQADVGRKGVRLHARGRTGCAAATTGWTRICWARSSSTTRPASHPPEGRRPPRGREPPAQDVRAGAGGR